MSVRLFVCLLACLLQSMISRVYFDECMTLVHDTLAQHLATGAQCSWQVSVAYTAANTGSTGFLVCSGKRTPLN